MKTAYRAQGLAKLAAEEDAALKAWAREMKTWDQRIAGFELARVDDEQEVRVYGAGSQTHRELADEPAITNLVSYLKELFPEVRATTVIDTNMNHRGWSTTKRIAGFTGSDRAVRAVMDWQENEGLREIPIGEYLAGLKGEGR
jgi:hypothetical protein